MHCLVVACRWSRSTQEGAGRPITQGKIGDLPETPAGVSYRVSKHWPHRGDSGAACRWCGRLGDEAFLSALLCQRGGRGLLVMQRVAHVIQFPVSSLAPMLLSLTPINSSVQLDLGGLFLWRPIALSLCFFAPRPLINRNILCMRSITANETLIKCPSL